ncbi:hypothetical protein [Actinoplanes sp. CA-252034]|uniref:hypothetical protein n=1 Tax=Actinoplanes sp. CA-252034 TaxID=3239906 RepID=UPI003D95544D
MRDEDEMTDERAVRLLLPLREEPEGPSRIDVRRTMVEGHRRRALRRWSSGAALIALTSVAAGGGTLAATALHEEPPAPRPVVTATAAATPSRAAAPAVPTGCTVVRLPTDDARKGVLTAGDPTGRYHAGRTYGPAKSPIIWKDGKILARPRLIGEDPGISDINSSGVAVGSAFIGERQQGYVYRDGRVTELDGQHTTPLAINDAGVVVGAIGEVLKESPVRWDSPTAKATRLPMPAGMTSGRADGVDEDGTVVGRIAAASREIESGYLWLPDGTGRVMEMPEIEGGPADYFWPESISDGWVAGRAVDDRADGSRYFTALRYRIADGVYETLPENVFPNLIAANGLIAGGPAARDRPPLITAGAEVVELPRYRTAKEYEITTFSADGRRLGGYTTDSDGGQVGTEPLLWTCR